MADGKYTIFGPGMLRAVQEAHAVGKRLVIASRTNVAGELVALGYFLAPAANEPPAVTWFRPDEITATLEQTGEPHLSDGKLDVAFAHPKQHERHVVIDVPAGEAYKIILRVLFRAQESGAATFVVQAEVRATSADESEWRPVVRYDCAHGFIHRDMLARDGTKTKVPFPGADPRSAVPAIITELQENLVRWLGDAGYDELDFRGLEHVAIAHELAQAKGKLMRMFDEPDYLNSSQSGLVTFSERFPTTDGGE